MSVLHNMPIGRKFLCAFSLVCFLCLALGAYSVFAFRRIAATSDDVSKNGFPAVVALDDARGALNRVTRLDLKVMLCKDAGCIEIQKKLRADQLRKMEDALSRYEKNGGGWRRKI
jgi:methyl-accepting chemotaxis protein